MKITKSYIGIMMLLSLFTTVGSRAQQDSQYTQYMYNTMTINSAYTGTRDMLSILALYRNQWVGLDGAPETLNFSIHSPVGDRVGLGFSIVSDKIFISDETNANGAFSYQIPVADGKTLSLGVNAGFNLLSVDFSRANTGALDPTDPNIQYNIENRFSPQIGVGAFYYTDKFYAGLSSPNLLETKHYNSNINSTANERTHMYFITGYVFDLNYFLKLKPALLVKAVSGAPLSVDVSANFLFNEKLTLGAAYRWDAAVSALAGFQISDKFMVGYAYDWETTELSRYNSGSHEIFIRFELFNLRKKILSPRFF
ncbi:type IX secretion system membrane protein PorP/SprF [Flavobacterium sp. Fl-318]|uniref:Type IX secretion system membrane protein PorP/SprF n=1 Tax=Flavobacterium cupriresistens TaxID=2893885 RepID=A0ABU4RC51_9FLAO|nr:MULTISPECIES: type IX secretion system membrane protein PorP/SprF [unclassified Flavobacterium]MDX6189433.1 type IX secretion system membrane protein PorP/SprF [Flavobacterium sp. Fl-318]UFH41527.1 type IX secretion system membrane protein PorP/SprF [Flavobacterium sp. F-323]